MTWDIRARKASSKSLYGVVLVVSSVAMVSSCMAGSSRWEWSAAGLGGYRGGELLDPVGPES